MAQHHVEKKNAMTITKRELVKEAARKLGIPQSDVARIFEGIFNTISRALA